MTNPIAELIPIPDRARPNITMAVVAASQTKASLNRRLDLDLPWPRTSAERLDCLREVSAASAEKKEAVVASHRTILRRLLVINRVLAATLIIMILAVASHNDLLLGRTSLVDLNMAKSNRPTGAARISMALQVLIDLSTNKTSRLRTEALLLTSSMALSDLTILSLIDSLIMAAVDSTPDLVTPTLTTSLMAPDLVIRTSSMVEEETASTVRVSMEVTRVISKVVTIRDIQEEDREVVKRRASLVAEVDLVAISSSLMVNSSHMDSSSRMEDSSSMAKDHHLSVKALLRSAKVHRREVGTQVDHHLQDIKGMVEEDTMDDTDLARCILKLFRTKYQKPIAS